MITASGVSATGGSNKGFGVRGGGGRGVARAGGRVRAREGGDNNGRVLGSVVGRGRGLEEASGLARVVTATGGWCVVW